MADKIVWVLGHGDEWVVRIDGHVIASGLTETDAERRAWKVAEFIQEGRQSAEIRKPTLGGAWKVLPGPIAISVRNDPPWFEKLRRFA